MTLLKNNSPKKTRDSDSESQHKEPQIQEILPEIEVQDFSPENKTQSKNEAETQKADLINRYKYNGTEEELKDILPDFARPEQKTIVPTEQTINLFDLTHMCQYYCAVKLTQPIPIQTAKIYDLELSFLQDKMKLYSTDYKEITEGIFKDKLYIYRDLFIIPEELYSVSGFLRHYFKIETIYVILGSGLVETRQTLYCNFWDKHLNTITDLDILSIQVKADQPPCLRCVLKCD